MSEPNGRALRTSVISGMATALCTAVLTASVTWGALSTDVADLRRRVGTLEAAAEPNIVTRVQASTLAERVQAIERREEADRSSSTAVVSRLGVIESQLAELNRQVEIIRRRSP